MQTLLSIHRYLYNKQILQIRIRNNQKKKKKCKNNKQIFHTFYNFCSREIVIGTKHVKYSNTFRIPINNFEYFK